MARTPAVRRIDRRTLQRLLLPAQVERFCLAYHENGCDPIAAVRQAFPKYANGTRQTVSRRARLLLAQPPVIDRLKELSEQAKVVAGVTRDYLIQRAKEIADSKPPEGQQFGGANVKALEFLGKIGGHIVDTKDITVRHQFETEDAILRRLRLLDERLEGLGGMKDVTPKKPAIEHQP